MTSSPVKARANSIPGWYLRLAARLALAAGLAVSAAGVGAFAQEQDQEQVSQEEDDKSSQDMPAVESDASELVATERPAAEPLSEEAPLSLFQSQKDGADQRSTPKVLSAQPGREGAITSSDLEAVGMEIFGLLNPEDGGLGYDLWRGSSRRSIDPVLAVLPKPGFSPARQKLFSSLLLSRAYDPGGPVGDTPFMTLRARKLYEAGQLRDAEMTLDQTSEPLVDLASLQLLSEIYLLTQRTRMACAIAARTRSASLDPFWSRLRTICYIIEDDRAAAHLEIDLLAEQGYDDPLFFLAVANRIDNAQLSYSGLELHDAIHFALLADGESVALDGFPGDVLKTRSRALRAASLLLAGVRGRGAEDLATIQIPLAEEGVMTGSVLPVDYKWDKNRSMHVQLAILYGSVVLGDDEAAALIVSESAALPSVRKASAIYQAMASTVMPIDRAKLLKSAWDDAVKYNRRSLFVALYRDALRALPIEPALDIFAADFAQASLAAGAYPEAAKWLGLGWQAEEPGGLDLDLGLGPEGGSQRGLGRDLGRGLGNDTLKDLSVALQIVAQETAEFEPEWNVAARVNEAGDKAKANDKDNEAALRRAVLEVRLFEAFGGKLDEETRQALAEYTPPVRGKMPETGVLSGLDAAARAGRKGEVILLTLVALGDSKSAQIPIIVTSKCIAALLRTGFMEQAQTLAIESLLADL